MRPSQARGNAQGLGAGALRAGGAAGVLVVGGGSLPHTMRSSPRHAAHHSVLCGHPRLQGFPRSPGSDVSLIEGLSRPVFTTLVTDQSQLCRASFRPRAPASASPKLPLTRRCQPPTSSGCHVESRRPSAGLAALAARGQPDFGLRRRRRRLAARVEACEHPPAAPRELGRAPPAASQPARFHVI